MGWIFYKPKLLVLLALLMASPGLASIVTVNEEFSSQLLGLHLEVFEDKASTLGLAEVQTRNFQPNKLQVPAIGYSQSTYWYRFDLANQTANSQKLFLELTVAWIDNFSIFYQEDDRWIQKDTGVAWPLAERSVKNNFPTHTIELPSNSQRQIYIRISSSDTLLFPIYLRSADYFESYVRFKDQLYGMFAGIMTVAAFYGFIFFVYTFNRAYLYYFFNVLSWVLMFAVFDGYGRELLFRDNFWWCKHINVLVMCSSLIWGGLFTMKILEVQTYSQRITRMIKAWVGLELTLAVLVFFIPYSVSMKTAALISLAFPVILVVTGLSALKHEFNIAKYYLMSWIFPIIGVTLYNGMVVGLVPGSSFSMYALHCGIICQSMFLSFALSYHLREATKNASILKVSVEAAGLAHSALMKSELNPRYFDLSYRYRPCEESGGDLFGCLQDPRHCYSYVIVADVSGHGIVAAIISSAFTGAFNAAVKGMQSLDLDLAASCKKIMNDINLVMCDYFARTNHFASAVLIGIDMRNGQAVYVNAGHRNIFLKQNSKVTAFLRGGTLIGFQTTSMFMPIPFQLAPNDVMVLFTDGLVENEIGRSEKSRLDLIIRSLKANSNPEDIVAQIWQSISQARDESLTDDMTLLVIKLTALMAQDERHSS